MDQEVTFQEAQNEKTESTPKKRKALTAFTTVSLVLVIILCVVVVSQVLSNGYVSMSGFSMFRVVTGSMEPEMPIGTLLISKETPIRDIRVGDIVNFRAKSSDMLGVVITHRVINILEDTDGNIYLETKGDANKYPDASYVEQRNLIGRVIYSTSDHNILAKLVGVLTSPAGFLACIVLPCLIFGVFTMRGCITSIQKEMKAMEREQEASNAAPQQIELDDYEALCDRIRGELLEELKQSADLEEKTE